MLGDPRLPARFWTRVRVTPDGCWTWVGRRQTDGYGMWDPHTTTAVLAHRSTYEALVGPVPPGCELDHLCRNRACVNPAHLEATTHRKNVLRGVSFAAVNAAKTHCVHGHPYDEANTYIRPNGARDCRACFRDRSRRYLERKAA